jgi:hypothetical protein
MHSAEMLIQVFEPREAFPRVSLAVDVRTVEGSLRPAMLPVYLSLVSQQPPGVGETGEFLTAFGHALVRALMLIHVFAKRCGG